MRRRRTDLEEKNALLAAMAKVVTGSSTLATVPAPVDVSDAAADWDSLIAALTAHEDYLEQQSVGLSRQVVENVARFKLQIRTLAAKWAEAKPDGTRLVACRLALWVPLPFLVVARLCVTKPDGVCLVRILVHQTTCVCGSWAMLACMQVPQRQVQKPCYCGWRSSRLKQQACPKTLNSLHWMLLHLTSLSLTLMILKLSRCCNL
jgi:hypothetical protein